MTALLTGMLLLAAAVMPVYAEDASTEEVFEGTYTEAYVEEVPEELYVDGEYTEEVYAEDSAEETYVEVTTEDISDAAASDSTASSKEDTYNVLLIGVDRRDDSWYGNSDVMILVTINYEKETIYLTSFLRDLYANIPGVGVAKLNAACANGGADLCVETIASNYQVKIDNYALVDFNSMIALVDAVGGVDLEITEDEMEVANGYIATMCEANGEPSEAHQITEAGMVHLDGYQTVGFMRNRYSGSGSDFGRTERQRKVLTAIIASMGDGDFGAGSAVSLVQTLLGYVQHDIGYLKMVQLLTQVPTISTFGLEQQHIPYDGMYYVENEILIPTDMQETISTLQNTIY